MNREKSERIRVSSSDPFYLTVARQTLMSGVEYNPTLAKTTNRAIVQTGYTRDGNE